MPPKVLNTQQEKEICVLYQEGSSSCNLAKQYKITPPTVLKALKYHGVQVRTNSECQRRYKINYSYFNDIRNQKQAYWLGFISADGYISKKRHELRINLAAKDADHLKRMRDDMDSNFPIHVYHYPDNPKANSRFPFAMISIRSVELITALQQYGLSSTKTFDLYWPSLPEPLYRHYLRGYFDGDGSFIFQRHFTVKHKDTVYSYHDPVGQAAFTMLGNKDFLLECQEYLMDTCNIKLTVLIRHRITKDIYTLSYKGNVQVKKIAHLMYHRCNTHLPRKRKLIEHLL